MFGKLHGGENRVGRNDPTKCPDPDDPNNDDCLAWNKLLVWHDSSSNNAISLEVIKTDVPNGPNQTLDNDSPIWLQIEERENLNNKLPSTEMLDQDLAAYSSL